MRVLLISISLIFSVTAFARQVTSQHTPTGHLWKLYQSHRLYDLQNELNKTGTIHYGLPVYWLFTAALQNSWMQADSSLLTLQKIKSKKLASFPDSLQFLYHSLMHDNYVKLFEYKKAALHGSFILRNYKSFFPGDEFAGFAEANSIWSALRNKKKQQIIHHRSSALSIKNDIAGLMNIGVSGKDSVFDFVFDTGAGISTIMESFAISLNLDFIDGITVPVRSGITGIPTQARLALAKSLKLGNMEIHNAVFLVFPDSALTFANGAYKIRGIIGFPVIKEMGELTFKSDSLFIIPNSLLAAERNLAVDNLKPYFFLRHNGILLPFTFDTGAQESIFGHIFYNENRKIIDETSKPVTKLLGGTNGNKSFNGFIVPLLTLQFQHHDILMNQVFVSKEELNVTGKYYYGNIGKDFTRKFKSMTMNFKKSYIHFN